MSKIELKIVGDDPDEIRETLAAVTDAFNTGQNVSAMSVKELTEELKRQLPSMDIVMTPKAKAEGAEPAKSRGRPKKEAEPEADPFAAAAEPAKAPEPTQTPAEMRQAAVTMLMGAYNDKAKQPGVLALLKKYGVKKFAEVGDDKAAELFADAKAI